MKRRTGVALAALVVAFWILMRFIHHDAVTFAGNAAVPSPPSVEEADEGRRGGMPPEGEAALPAVSAVSVITDQSSPIGHSEDADFPKSCPASPADRDASEADAGAADADTASATLHAGGPAHLFAAIGDSLTRGVGDETKSGGYVGYVQAEFNRLRSDGSGISAVNFGKSGHRSEQLLERLESGELAEVLCGAAWIAVSIGGNDLLQVVRNHILHLTYEPFYEERIRFESRLRSVLRILREYNPEAPIYVLGLFNPFRDFLADVPETARILQEWNDALRKAAEEWEGAVYVPIADLFAEQGDQLLSDDLLHPNGSGYALIGKRILTQMTSAGKEAAG